MLRSACKGADSKHRNVTYQVREFALLSTKGMKLSPLATKKLLSKWLGPFEVTKRVGEVAYELVLPASMGRVHPVISCVAVAKSVRMVNVILHLHLLCCLMMKKNVKFSKCWLIGSVPLAGIASISSSILCLGKAWGLRIVNGNTQVI